MPKYLIAAGRSDGSAQDLNLTYYYFPIGYLSPQASVLEASAQVLARDTYTLSGLYVYVSANTVTDATTVRSRKNGANGNLTISIPASTTGAFTEAAPSSDSLVSGDLFCTQIVTPNAGISITFTIISYILSTPSNTTPILAATGFLSQGVSLTRYSTVGGYCTGIATEAIAYYTFRVAATLSNLRIYASGNTITAASTLVTRINGVNGNQSVTIPASSSGSFEDIINTDIVPVGQNVYFRLITGGTGTTLTTRIIQVKSNSAGRQVIAASGGVVTLSFGLTRYITIEGSSQLFNGTESLVQATARASFTAKNMYIRIGLNSVNGSTTFNLRKNTADSGLTVSVPASTTGQFEDTAHTANYITASLIDWQVITGGASGTITISTIGFELAQWTPSQPPVGMAAKMMAAGGI